jgi:hypothetical protein
MHWWVELEKYERDPVQVEELPDEAQLIEPVRLALRWECSLNDDDEGEVVG